MASFVNSPAVTLCPPQAVPFPAPSSTSVCCTLNIPASRSSFSITSDSILSLRRKPTITLQRSLRSPLTDTPNFQVVAAAEAEPLKILISGAPAAGKGTQCELIAKKYGLVHISTGDLLRADIKSGSENGRRVKENMEKGLQGPDEILVLMIKEALSRPDSQQNGWILDGYPRSLSQAISLQRLGFNPDLFILLEVPEDILVERVIGRRFDPVTGKIYHLKYSPPETEEIAARLTQRFDDTKEKVKLRLKTHNQNARDLLTMYQDITVKIKGNCSKDEVFGNIDNALTKLAQQKDTNISSFAR